MSDAVGTVSGSSDKRQKIKKDQEYSKKYDSRRVYLGKAWDEWERQRAISGKSHSLFAAQLLERHAVCRPTCSTCLPHDAPIIITDCDR